MDLLNKTILITGASDGIGEVLAVEFSKLGSNIVLLGRDPSKLDKVYDRLDHSFSSQKHLILQADLSLLSNKSAHEILIAITGEFNCLDGIIHNAAILFATTLGFCAGSTSFDLYDCIFITMIARDNNITK